MESSRRGFLGLAMAASWERALAGAAAAQQQQLPAETFSGYRFVFFTAREQETVRRYAALVIPADERSGGALAARVEEYIDFILAHGEAGLQRIWRAGLGKWGREKNADRLLERLSRSDDRFFETFRSAVVEGFYTSEEGIRKELGYQGLAHLREFPGCTHETHEIPAGYRPALRRG
jgi:hypothetical protein